MQSKLEADRVGDPDISRQSQGRNASPFAIAAAYFKESGRLLVFAVGIL